MSDITKEFIFRKIKRNLRKSDDFIVRDKDLKEIKEKKHHFISEDGNLESFITNIISNKILKKLEPSSIDIHHFWNKCMEVNPLISILGSDPVITKDNALQYGFETHRDRYQTLDYIADAVFTHKKVLEIGCGFGHIYNLFKEYDLTNNYYALDIQQIFECENFYLGDGKSIPKEIPKIDLVYSLNVFQHLDSNQRTGYYTDIFEKLKNGGTFVFGLFGVDDENIKNERIWGYRDENDNRYCQFFNQFTICPRDSDVLNELNQIGFSNTRVIRKCGVNYLIFEAVK